MVSVSPALLVVAALVLDAPKLEDVSTCRAEPAQAAVGQVATTAVLQEARAAAGAASLRTVLPGQSLTKEYNTSRLTVDIDDAGRISRVTCR